MAIEAPTPVTKYEIARLELKKGDTVVFKTPDELHPETRQTLIQQLSGCFPGHQILVLDRGTSIDVLDRNAD